MVKDTSSDRLQRAFVCIVGEQRIAEMNAAFRRHFMDSLTDEQRSAIKSVNVLPEVFAEWYEQGCPDFLDGLSNLSVHIDSLCTEHDPCTFSPFRPWIVVFLDKNKPFPKRYIRLRRFAGMDIYFYSI